MAAGLGFKTFTTGEVLTAADTNGYLMQGVLVFASAAARDAAITSPQEGQFAYLKDTNVTTYYTGSAWANLDTTGMTNPMTTTGDTIYSSSGSTPARLGIGSTGQVMTVASGIPSWATPSAGGMTLLSTTTLSGASTTISSIDQTYTNLNVFVYGITMSADATVKIEPNAATSSVWSVINYANVTDGPAAGAFNLTSTNATLELESTSSDNAWSVIFSNYSSTASQKPISAVGGYVNESSSTGGFSNNGYYKAATAISSLKFTTSTGTFSTGTVLIYGVK
jgi:hypothetical protein